MSFNFYIETPSNKKVQVAEYSKECDEIGTSDDYYNIGIIFKMD